MRKWNTSSSYQQSSPVWANSMPEMMRAAAEHKLLPLFKALQYVTFQTANIPLTQGYKMSLRQLGFALNVYDGPLTVFLTTNFADMYSPTTATLMNGAGEPPGKHEVNLLDNAPCMPTLQAMHRALAKHPMLQVELFLLLDDLVHTELCCMNAFIGKKRYGDVITQPFREDDFATTGQVGIAQFPRSALKPLEAQGRGFTHGHEKIISVPRTRAARLKHLFTEAAATSTEKMSSADGASKRGRQCCKLPVLCNTILPCSRAPSLELHCDQNLFRTGSRNVADSMDKWKRLTIMHPGDTSFQSLSESSTAT